MNIILLLAAIVLFAMYSISMKFAPSGNLRLTVLVTAAYTGWIFLVCLVIFCGGNDMISSITAGYGMLWGVGCVATQVLYFLAMQNGPLSYTTFIFSASMIIPTLCSSILWKEIIMPMQWLGIMLFLTAFYLVGVPGAERGGQMKKCWLPLCLLACLCNGLLSTVSKAQQIAMDGKQVIPMLVVSFGSASVAAFLAFFVLAPVQKEKVFTSDICIGMKRALIPVIGMAFANGTSNGLVTYLSSRVSSAWLFPCVLGGSMMLVTLFSALVLKEKINRWGKLGLAVGFIAMFVLNMF